MEHSPDGRPSERTINVGGITVFLSRRNTRLRLFHLPSYDHVDLQVAPDKVLSFCVTDEIMEDLINRDYPRVLMDIRDDPASKEWYEANALGDLAGRETLFVEDITHDPF